MSVVSPLYASLCLFPAGQIWGNLISSAIFSQAVPDNVTIADDVLATCGANFCPSDYQNNTNLDRPDLTKVAFIWCRLLIENERL